MAKIKIVDAFKNRDLKSISLIMDYLRFNLGLDYMGSYKAINNKVPMTLDEYEELMYDVDCFETQQGMLS